MHICTAFDLDPDLHNVHTNDGALAKIDEPVQNIYIIQLNTRGVLESENIDISPDSLHLEDNLRIMELLIEAGVDVNYTDNGHSRSVLMNHAQMGNTDHVKFLLENGADPNFQDQDERETALMLGIHHYDVTKLLLENGANPFIMDLYGRQAFDSS